MVLNWNKCHLKSASFLVVFFSYGFLQRENRAFVFGMRTDGGRVLTKTAAAHWRDRSTLTSQSNEIPGYIMEKSTIRHQKRLIVVRSSSSMQSGFLRNFTLLTYSKVVFQLFCPFTQPSPLQFVIQAHAYRTCPPQPSEVQPGCHAMWVPWFWPTKSPQNWQSALETKYMCSPKSPAKLVSCFFVNKNHIARHQPWQFIINPNLIVSTIFGGMTLLNHHLGWLRSLQNCPDLAVPLLHPSRGDKFRNHLFLHQSPGEANTPARKMQSWRANCTWQILSKPSLIVSDVFLQQVSGDGW